ncbi:MAG: hypothetical protein B7Y02_14305 [Rhodobacterales bacterium 17-64-5]|nr:MAG: hypothetical protein B7Y02_14305 [Rhodobacterales bacterium 17-64-5]
MKHDPSKSGIYHFSGEPDVSWHVFAQEIISGAARDTTLAPISTRDYPTPAVRPLNSRLDCGTTEDVFGLHRPNWRLALVDVLKELEKRA